MFKPKRPLAKLHLAKTVILPSENTLQKNKSSSFRLQPTHLDDLDGLLDLIQFLGPLLDQMFELGPLLAQVAL